MMGIIVSCDVKIFNSTNELCFFFAEYLMRETLSSQRKYNIALSGGKTPLQLYSYLAEHYQSKIIWENINFFWGDERCVPPDNQESNYKSAYEIFLSKVSVPEKNIFRIKGESNPASETERYGEVISKNVEFGNSFPKFDLILLGIGEDGHTASIFPDQLELISVKRICSIAVHPVTHQKRITLTGTIINNAKSIIFVVTGQNKKEIVSEIIEQKDEKEYPASYIKPTDGKFIWLLDKDAASRLRYKSDQSY